MRKILFALVAIILISSPAAAREAEESDSGRVLPRMAAFRSNLINARSGPGSRYPIEWVYKQKNAPVEIIAEFDLWRKIKDWEGSVTWVHKSMLHNKRWIKMTTKETGNIYAKPQSDAKIIARVEDQVIGQVEKCPAASEFCLIKFSSIEGWVNKKDFFGVYAGEVIE